MKLTKRALKKIDTTPTRLKLALALGCQERWIMILIARNKDNGPLTSVKALEVILAETKFSQGEILEETAIGV